MDSGPIRFAGRSEKHQTDELFKRLSIELLAGKRKLCCYVSTTHTFSKMCCSEFGVGRLSQITLL